MIYFRIPLFFVVISNFSARLDLCKSAFRHFNTENNIDNHHNFATSPKTPAYIEVYDNKGTSTKCWGISRYLTVDKKCWLNLIDLILIMKSCN